MVIKLGHKVNNTDVEGMPRKQVSSLYPCMLVYLPRQLLLGP